MKSKQIIKFSPIILFVVILLIGIMPLTAKAKKIKIIIMPFSIKAYNGQNYNFLVKGISQMLQSRLDIPDASVPVSPGTPEADTADNTLSGSISILKDSITTSAELVDKKTGKIIVDFKKSGKSKSDILRHINLLSQQIKADVLHIKPTNNFEYEELTDNEEKTKSSGSGKLSQWSSRAFNKNFISMSIADINGDSKNETIVATEKKVYIFLRKGGLLRKITEFKSKKHTKIISVDAGDINNNKKAEIYVTCIDENTDRPASFVMEWNGAGFSKILDNQNWLFRIIRTKTRGTMLLGQIPGSGGSMLNSKVYQLNWQGMKLASKALKLPQYISIYSFTFGDVMNNGSEMLVALTSAGKIEVFNSAGKRIWRSIKNFGGTYTAIEYKGEFYNGANNFQMSRIFLQQRIFISDFDHNGKNSIFIVRNQDITSSLLANTRFFTKSYIVSMIWDKNTFIPDGRTQVFTGYISDYAIADQNNDGKKELVFAIPILKAVLHQRYSCRLYSIGSLSVKAGKTSTNTQRKTYKPHETFKIQRMNPL